ncbi:MAG: hypothetical protein AVDCRST_MAG77-4469 [uncultured Chloroflexi bacterium]|uniref:Helix-hairpin-helix domain-containing protein n=1 Tax=uncultured Chloroflexota bacterium TaxID=166587 RepID=A0A6J4JUE5_9CHLR|nr:MAG: hypothetical protein AVDCRST_MAG77-4469 [uncultured Chloroflexota bacterium]
MNRRFVLTTFTTAAGPLLAACGGEAGTAAQPTTAAAVPTSAPPATSSAGSSGAAAQPTAAVGASAVQPVATTVAAAPVAVQPTATKLNLNTATREQFLTVPNVGDRMVREFFEYRPYRSIQQFRREIGKYVAQDVVAAYEQHVYMPVNPNEADADTLRQLPEVDAAIAAQLIAGRPYANADAFVARLGQLTTPAQATAARTYLA